MMIIKTMQLAGSLTLVIIAAMLSFIAMVMAFVYVSQTSTHVTYILIGFILIAATSEIALQKIVKREIQPRVT
jgi:hypothetical protein